MIKISLIELKQESLRKQEHQVCCDCHMPQFGEKNYMMVTKSTMFYGSGLNDIYKMLVS